MDPDELTALQAQIAATTAAILAATATPAQDNIEAEEAHSLLAPEIAIVNRLIAQLITTRTTNNDPTLPYFASLQEHVSGSNPKIFLQN